jgi:cytochrome P450
MFGAWTSTLGLAFGAIADPSTRARVEDALAHLDAFVRSLIDERAARPGDDLLSALIEVREGSDRLDADELVTLVENLLFAGHDTTRGALAAMVTLLARHPDQYRAVTRDPQLIRGAVEEALRYEPISFGTARFAAQETAVAGVTIPAGTAVGLCLVSAARDARRYTDPQSFDVRRDEGLTPAFGAGIHYCVGAALARAEMEEALAALVEHASELTLTREPEWVPFASIRHFQPPVLVALAP